MTMKIYLPAGAVSVAEPVTFGTAFPGRYEPGGAGVAPADIGMTEEEAAERIAASGVPLVLAERKPRAASPEPEPEPEPGESQPDAPTDQAPKPRGRKEG